MPEVSAALRWPRFSFQVGCTDKAKQKCECLQPQLELTYLHIWRWLWTRGQLTFKKQKQPQRQPKRKRPATLKTETFLSNPETNVKVLQERQGEGVKDSQHELCLLSENNIRLTDHL